ncbi:ABC transporter substrate-binding protein [Achromobacter seleniivolatilans]|uniref:ABC transporter substrate-binding protein n=1 Tax=Achromobacter seleniivolatilans TaxID=3047478 RepID=A0ABY9M5V8_9BURK|nr:ABC transporter substrate-binding protein [Achromobacter sp. R39]WMD22095.1 ABC transporter substrate-binding protein [Achromobacter sp. R39]
MSFPLMHMAHTGALRDHAVTLEYRHWQNPDQLRVLLARKEVDITAAPSSLAALLANRGESVRLVNISVWGILWLVSRDPAVRSFGDLQGQELLVPFQRDLPATLIDRLLTSQTVPGVEPVRQRRTRDAQDAIALMLAGQGKHAVLVEPAVSLLLWRDAQQGSGELRRVESLEQAWRVRFPEQPELPQAGVMLNSTVAGDAKLAAAVERAYAESAVWCKAQVSACAEIVRVYLPQLPQPAIEDAIRSTRLDSRSASAVRPQLEALYRLLGDEDLQAIGGRLPDVGFYGP